MLWNWRGYVYDGELSRIDPEEFAKQGRNGLDYSILTIKLTLNILECIRKQHSRNTEPPWQRGWTGDHHQRGKIIENIFVKVDWRKWNKAEWNDKKILAEAKLKYETERDQEKQLTQQDQYFGYREFGYLKNVIQNFRNIEGDWGQIGS